MAQNEPLSKHTFLEPPVGGATVRKKKRMSRPTFHNAILPGALGKSSKNPDPTEPYSLQKSDHQRGPQGKSPEPPLTKRPAHASWLSSKNSIHQDKNRGRRHVRGQSLGNRIGITPKKTGRLSSHRGGVQPETFQNTWDHPSKGGFCWEKSLCARKKCHT